MSLYGEYLKERTEKSIIEDERGFATYYFVQDGCYIEDIFVHPDLRGSQIASQMTDEIARIAKSKGCTKLYGTICPSAKNSTSGLKALLAYGFQLDSCVNNFIAMKKDI